MKITFAVFYFNLMNLLRNFKSAGIMFILPVVFMGVFAVAFGGNAGNINLKTGLYVQPEIGSQIPDIKEILKQVDDQSDSIKITTTVYQDINSLKDEIKKDKLNTGIILTSSNNSNIPFSINIIGKENNLEFQQNKGILNDVFYNAILPDSKVISSEVLNKNVSTSVFNILAPGLIIYGLLILIPGIAQSFTTITEKNYIFRFANSKAKSFHIIFGSILYYLLISVVQVLILYFTAVAFGYKATGNVFLAFIPALLTSLFVIGIGLLIGSYVKKSEASTNIGTIISIIFGFFSGSFINGIGSVMEFNLFNRVFQFNDFLPSKWGTTAIDKILTQNLTLSDITLELSILAISGLVIIAIGIVVYQKRQLNVKV
ncbi:MAG: ABC transporter permease [bacterium]